MVHGVHHVHGDISIVGRNAGEVVQSHGWSGHRCRHHHHRPDTERLRDFSGVQTRDLYRGRDLPCCSAGMEDGCL